jgi:GT2 family glycosyltransferase
MRPLAIKKLLDSVLLQTKMPAQIIIVDGSTNNETKCLLNESFKISFLDYFLVNKEDRGLTRQRNFGVRQLKSIIDIVCFLDDDLVLDVDYFEQIENTYHQYPDAIGAGGIDMKENRYFLKQADTIYNKFEFYELDGWVSKEPLRYKVRKLVGLMPDLQPDIVPSYSHGRSGFPANGKIYEVEHFMGGIGSYRKILFNHIFFSKYFEGYGLYEDFDFCVRALLFGKLYVNTNAKVWHYHDPSGRPDYLKYGKMVVRNGWYVWRLRFPNPTLSARLKWNATVLLLAFFRFLNVVTGPQRMEAFAEFRGRLAAWVLLIFVKPSIDK